MLTAGVPTGHNIGNLVLTGPPLPARSELKEWSTKHTGTLQHTGISTTRRRDLKF